MLGDIATHQNRFDSEHGIAHYLASLALAEPRGMRPLVAHCHFGLGKLKQGTGERDEATEHFAAAIAMYRDMGMTYWLKKAETKLSDQH